MKHDSHRGHAPATQEQKPSAAHDPIDDQAQAIIAQTGGDPHKLAQLLPALAAKARDAVLAMAQRVYGNKFVTTALQLQDGGATGGAHQRTDGVHGLEGAKSLADKDTGAKQAPKLLGAAQQGRYGDTFGANRFGNDQGVIDGGKNHKFGKGRTSSGFEDHSGDAGMFANTGGAGVVSYPSSGTPSGGANLLDVPAKEGTGTSTPMTNGDTAGTAGGVASEKLGGSVSFTGVSMGKVGAGGGAAPAARVSPSTPGMFIALSSTTPREDQDAGGGPVVLSRADAHGVGSQLDRQLGAHHQAGGSNDGRGDTGNTAGHNAGGGMVATKRETLGGRGEELDHGGSLNYDAILKINALVNPGRT
ncbi:MAG: hypothetical protein IPQ07_16555 [Myxococcales bacterium]|nr:hypothetical protein [Myxococcales bacterium]